MGEQRLNCVRFWSTRADGVVGSIKVLRLAHDRSSSRDREHVGAGGTGPESSQPSTSATTQRDLTPDALAGWRRPSSGLSSGPKLRASMFPNDIASRSTIRRRELN
jgi:hypothetical protein